jgi:SAM-dependent methyltransferase
MISIIVVYNNRQTLDEVLLESLKSQSVKFDIIAIDNTKGRFKSAAEALNYGGEKATGKYLMFVHQDVELDSNLWLENVEKLLDNIPDLGIAGVVGMSEKGSNNKERGRGYISDCGEIWQWSNAVQKPEEVQTLDECLLIVPKTVFEKYKFDEKTFDGWHYYGADYCLSVRQMGLKAYVIPAFIYYRSLRSNSKGLLEYQKRLYKKHQKNYRNIYTTTGEISKRKLILRTIQAFLHPFSAKLFTPWTEYLKKELSDCNTVLDLGCGYNSPIQYCNVHYSVGVELFEPYLQESQKKHIHNEYIKADIRNIEFKPKSFDAVLCSEVLEHLTKEEGYELIKKMEKWAIKKIIITTPNEYLWQDGYDNNPMQEHKSGWSVEELENLGFKVFGMNGWKKLKGYKGLIKYKPTFLWQRISDLTQKITYRYPKYAFQLFAIKKLKKTKNEFS